MSTAMACDAIGGLRRQLRAARNPDGGWPYFAGKSSRLEPTAWATLALQAPDDAPDVHVSTFFAARRRPDGLLADAAGINFAANALALIALAGMSDTADVRRQALTAVLHRRGVKLAPATQYCQNNQLSAWSWLPGAFSWVEPTAWTLVALKQDATLLSGRAADLRNRRIHEAERLLLDRACVSGGWNYGNANMYGRELHAHLPTTAVALLAMQDQQEEPAVRRGLRFLEGRRLSEPTGMALALTAIALRVFGRPSRDVGLALLDWTCVSGSTSHVLVTAMAAYALGEDQNDCAAFRFSSPARRRS